MRLPEFSYIEPINLDQVCAFLADHKGDARLIAGGTDLLVAMKLRMLQPKYLVSLKKIPGLDLLNYDDKNGLSLGPLVTLRSLELSPLVREKYFCLAQAAASVGSWQIRNQATISGNICLDSRCLYYNNSQSWWRSRPDCYHRGGDCCYVIKGGKQCYATHVADTVPVLIGLGAMLRVVGTQGEREIALDDFYTGDGKAVHTLKADEVVAEIKIPPVTGRTRGIFIKHRLRESIDFGLLNVAVVLELVEGVCRQGRIVVSAVAPRPIRAIEAEKKLKGQRLSQDVVEEVANAAVKEVKPISNSLCIGVTAGYRRKLVKALVERALEQVIQEEPS